MTELPQPPRAEQRPHEYSRHGHTIQDPYHWMKDQGYPEVNDKDVLDYLKAENAYFDAQMKPREQLVDTLFKEMKGRIKEDDSSVPQKDGDWLYWYAYQVGGQYPIHYRKPVAGGPDEVLFDEPKEAEGKEYFRLGILEVSPDGKLIAWADDTNGAERFTLKVRDLASGKDLETISAVVNGDVVWARDSKSLIYTEVNDQWRSYRALHHVLGTDPRSDKVLYEEKDELGFSVGVGDTQDEEWIIIATGDNQTSEI
ncbi:MAG: S9 family peptidase, partial [Sphingomonadaceae bacterium]